MVTSRGFGVVSSTSLPRGRSPAVGGHTWYFGGDVDWHLMLHADSISGSECIQFSLERQGMSSQVKNRADRRRQVAFFVVDGW